MIKSTFVLFTILLVAQEIKSDGSHHDGPPPGIPTPPGPGGYNLPPPPTPEQPPAGLLGGGIPGGILGFPGFGFQKSLNLNAGAGFGPFLGGIPPPPVAPGGVPPVDGGIGGELPVGGFPGGFNPSYVPSTWLGSALGAKGDILFPCVIIIFFLVGVWTVINFLLVLVVPLIGAKMGVVNAIANAKGAKFSRSVSDGNRIECDAKNVTEAIEKYAKKYMEDCGCNKQGDEDSIE
jgi:hypothetical protein